MICDFCNNKFSSTSSLLFHQRTTKYCLVKQNKEIVKKFTCTGCNSEFTRKQDFSRHISVCKANNFIHDIVLENNQLKDRINLIQSQFCEKDKQIEKLENQNKELQCTIEKLAMQAISRPTTTTTKNTQINNYIQKLQPITDDILKDNVPNLTIEHILKGPEGYAEYAMEYPLKNRIICVDYARRKVKFKDSQGNIVTDPEMSSIATKFFQSIKDKNKFLIFEYGNAMKERFGDELETIVKIMDNKMNVDNGADGAKTEFYHDFVKSICNKTVVE